MPAAAARSWWSWIGLAAGPGLWAAGTQAKYALVPWTCAGQAGPMALGISVLTALLAAAAATLSWRAWQSSAEDGLQPEKRQTTRFLAGLSALTTALFTLTILLQGAAGLVFDGCAP